MTDPLSLASVIGLLVKYAPEWLHSLEVTLRDKGKDLAKQRIKEYFDNKKQIQHLELALKNAAERGLRPFTSLGERDQYRNVLQVLSEPGPHSETLRKEALRLFTLSDSPDLAELQEIYNRALRIRTLSNPEPPKDVDVVPYLNSFFKALLAELYIDPLFHEQVSDVLKVRSTLSMQRSFVEIISTLHQIGEALAPDYTSTQFEQDVATYAAYLERAYRHLKLVGVVSKGQGDEDIDPELSAIFIPLHIVRSEQVTLNEKMQESILSLFNRTLCTVLLGGPGSGKSTTTRYLTWSHAHANLLHGSSSLTQNASILPGTPLPLRIELRRLVEDRRYHPHYNFLSYATEILLERAGVSVNQRMFEELLERRAMLVLFDGLDEVATLDTRLKLVEEIEEFTLHYPGNRILVTSRLIGYESARCSSRIFAHFLLQELNDQQIHLFLEYWYTHVRRLTPLPLDDQQELEILYTTLTNNFRLHALASNPLLLTVITGLHRYERLPDRRVQVYDRCADLLLNIWAKLRGTVARWQNMKMSKEIQYACVAYLGFVLHKNSQGNLEKTVTTVSASSNRRPTENTANDVSTRFMLREIIHFLEGRDLFSAAERHIEAELFLELVQTEAGLIVERGTDNNGEALYGFVHRTFQEYFAAAYVYEHYQEQEDATIISQFLEHHLYDPHWNEVILLLFGKLKVRPATTQLRLLLEGQDQISGYSDITQHRLFFVSTCLCEEVIVEHELAVYIVSRLGYFAKNSPFPSQRDQALRSLTALAGTRHYGNLARKELQPVLIQKPVLDTAIKVEIAQVLHEESPKGSEEWKQTFKILLSLMQQPDTHVDRILQIITTLFTKKSLSELAEQQQLNDLFLNLLQRPVLSFEQKAQIAKTFYLINSGSPEEQQKAVEIFLNWIQQPQISFEETILIAKTLYQISPNTSRERQEAVKIFLNSARQPRISFEKVILIVETLYQISADQSEGQLEATQELLKLLHLNKTSFAQAVQIARILCKNNALDADKQQQVSQTLLTLIQKPGFSATLAMKEIIALYDATWDNAPKKEENKILYPLILTLVQRLDLPFENAIAANGPFYRHPMDEYGHGYEDEAFGNQIILSVTQRSNLSFDQAILAANAFYPYGYHYSYQLKELTSQLLAYIQQPDLSIEQSVMAAKALYTHSSTKSQAEYQAAQMLWQLINDTHLSDDQRLKLATIPVTTQANFPDRVSAVREMLTLIGEEKTAQHLEIHWKPIDDNQKADTSDVPALIELVKQNVVPVQERDKIYKILSSMPPQLQRRDT